METKKGSKKLLLFIEVILIILGIVCSTYSLVMEINGTNGNNAPAPTGQVSATTGEAPAATGDEPAATGEAPAATGDAPAATGEAPAATGDAPAATGDAPAATGEAPAATGDEPAATGEAPAATGEAPAVTGEAPAVTGEAPAATGEAPAATGDTPAATGEEPPEGQLNNGIPQQMMEVGSVAVKYIFMALPILMFLLAGIYCFIGYRKPHGNILRYAMLVFGLYLVIEGVANNLFTCQYILPVTGAIVAYMSGRLNKEKKNRVLAVIIAALLLSFGILEIVNNTGSDVISIYSNLGNFVIWIIFTNAYFARFKEHVQAGIESDNAAEEKLISEE